MAVSPTLQRTVVPAREGRAVLVSSGQRVRVVDLEGGQVGDVFVFARDDLSEHHSASHTRAQIDRLFPKVGEQFFTNRRRPVLTLVEDTSVGRHDMLIAACDPERYASLGVAGWHASCADNLRLALAPFTPAPPVVPQPINIFMRIPVDEHDDLSWLPAATGAGDSITFRAEMDCVVVVSSCPQDIAVINGGVPTSLAIDVLEAEDPAPQGATHRSGKQSLS
ncbi:DUF1989 domain-containing protein [Streptosporangium sp. CA-135522]|uniref:DUF1989 domain-containing protein n=1 Tax=Streptosporangium sp. CA-135522 TaxID=3240072 RepID=UPI003D948DBC